MTQAYRLHVYAPMCMGKCTFRRPITWSLWKDNSPTYNRRQLQHGPWIGRSCLSLQLLPVPATDWVHHLPAWKNSYTSGMKYLTCSTSWSTANNRRSADYQWLLPRELYLFKCCLFIVLKWHTDVKRVGILYFSSQWASRDPWGSLARPLWEELLYM